MLIELDKQIMILLNKSISNPVFDFLMPLITNNKFLGFIGILLIAHLLINCGSKGKISFLGILPEPPKNENWHCRQACRRPAPTIFRYLFLPHSFSHISIQFVSCLCMRRSIPPLDAKRVHTAHVACFS